MGIKKLFSNPTSASVPDSDSAKHITTIPGKASKTLADLLRITGDHAFPLPEREVEDIQLMFSQWAEHVLSGKALVNDEEGRSQEGRRRWQELLDFFSEHRELEGTFVRQGLANLRDLFWQFARVVAQNMAQDRASDGIVKDQLEKLKEALGASSVDKLRHEADVTVKVISDLSNQRQNRHREQLRELGKKLRQMRVELEAARRQLVLDPLTQLYNRKALDEHIIRIADLSVFSGKPACILMVDIDHFKIINDSFGHPAGDTVIRGLGKLLIENFPRKTDFVARYGGEEFAIILQEDGLDVAQVLAKRLLKTVAAKEFRHEQATIQVTISVGIAELNLGEEPERWVMRADSALYEAKKSGRNCIQLST